MYYLGLDQYHYPIPYFDARNGPPNCLLHNEGNGTFVERTEAAGLNAENDRYSFSCAWGDSNCNGLPDLFVANDFGSHSFIATTAMGRSRSSRARPMSKSVGAGMSCALVLISTTTATRMFTCPACGRPRDKGFQSKSSFTKKRRQNIRELYQRHARGNALYRNQGDGTFQNVGQQAGVEMGRWSWSSDFWDFDHDGYSDLYVANGYLSATRIGTTWQVFSGGRWSRNRLKTQPPRSAYEHGWNAINELIRSDSTWHGYARNVMFANNRDGTFSEVSGAVGLDFLEDSRTFVLADLDHDGRLEVILKNRNAPAIADIAQRDEGHRPFDRVPPARPKEQSRRHRSRDHGRSGHSPPDKVSCRQDRDFWPSTPRSCSLAWEKPAGPVRATIRWPSGLSQQFEGLPVNHRIEIEEGSAAFAAKPFAATPAYAQAGPQPALEPLPVQSRNLAH